MSTTYVSPVLTCRTGRVRMRGSREVAFTVKEYRRPHKQLRWLAFVDELGKSSRGARPFGGWQRSETDALAVVRRRFRPVRNGWNYPA